MSDIHIKGKIGMNPMELDLLNETESTTMIKYKSWLYYF